MKRQPSPDDAVLSEQRSVGAVLKQNEKAFKLSRNQVRTEYVTSSIHVVYSTFTALCQW